MDIQKIKDYGAILGYVVGISGFTFGYYKYRRLRAIEKRGKAPFFVPRYLEIDGDRKLDVISGVFSIVYPPQLRTIEANLALIHSSQDKVFDNYPDGRVVGIIIENKGARIRDYKVKSKTEHKFHPYIAADPRERHNFLDFYTFRYRFRRADMGKPLKFKIWFEVESGFKGRQVWLTEQGILTIKRVKPKSV